MALEIHLPARRGSDADDSHPWRPCLTVYGYDGTDLDVDPIAGAIVGEWHAIPDEARTLDFPTPAELCKCCGQVLLASGSRFSIWFCEQCDEHIRQLNDEARRLLIPRGRHSVCNGVPLIPADRPTDHQLDTFVDAMRALGHSIDILYEWAPEIVRRNCARLGLAERTTIPLAEYLRDCDEGRLSREDAFAQLVAWRANRKGGSR